MGIAIQIADANFTKYIGMAEIVDEPVTPEIPDVPVCQHEYDNEYDTTCNKCGAVREVIVPDTYPDTYPDTDTLRGLFYLGGTADDSIYNHAVEGGGSAVIPSGSIIVYADHYATFSGGTRESRIASKVFTTGPESGVTMVALVRINEGYRNLFSTQSTSENKGFFFTNDRVFAYLNGAAGANYSYKTGIPASSSFVVCAFMAGADGLRVVKRGADRVVTELFDQSGVLDAWSATSGITIGGSQTNTGDTGSVDIALASIHEGVLTDDQLRQIFDYVYYYGVSKGLTVE